MTAPRRRWTFGLRALFALVTLAGVAALQVVRYWDSIRPIEWGAFSRQAVQQGNALGHDVLVSFIAAWSLHSKVQHEWIDTPSIHRLLRSKQIVAMKADWTHSDPAVTAEIKSLGKGYGIPMLVIYPASGSPPIVMRDLVSAEYLIAQLKKR